MDLRALGAEYLPMSESAYYILLSLSTPRHGYGVILHVEELTAGRLRLGAGTIYGTLARFETDGLIVAAGESERRKLYALTQRGRDLLGLEIMRLRELLEHARVEGEMEA
jgi:DNA-binding PadR family transcriptional regulator